MLTDERQLTIIAQIKNIESACDFVALEAERAGLDDDGVYHCRLSVEEICTNIIEHGYAKSKPNAVIDIICRKEPGYFSITIVDDAPAFNPLVRPDPDPMTPLWEREGGGWGIFFVKKYMHSVTYALNGGRNTLMLKKRIG